MHEKAGYHIGNGISWFGFWVMLGLCFFGEADVTYNPITEQPTEVVENE